MRLNYTDLIKRTVWMMTWEIVGGTLACLSYAGDMIWILSNSSSWGRVPQSDGAFIAYIVPVYFFAIIGIPTHVLIATHNLRAAIRGSNSKPPSFVIRISEAFRTKSRGPRNLDVPETKVTAEVLRVEEQSNGTATRSSHVVSHEGQAKKELGLSGLTGIEPPTPTRVLETVELRDV